MQAIFKQPSAEEDKYYFMKKCSSFQIRVKQHRETTASKIIGQQEVARTAANSNTELEEVGVATLVVPQLSENEPIFTDDDMLPNNIF